MCTEPQCCRNKFSPQAEKSPGSSNLFLVQKTPPAFCKCFVQFGCHFGRDSHLGYTSPLPKRFPRGHREKGAFKPNASRLEAVYDHCLIFNLPPEIKSFSCYQELKKGIDKAERELPVKSVNRILEEYTDHY